MEKKKSDGEEAVDRMLQNFDSQQKASVSADSYKKDLEFNRYKQDCRKRALELAHGEHDNWWIQKTKTAGTTDIAEPNVHAIADKYYNWLISIPQ